MDIILVALAVTTFVLGLLWLTQKFFTFLPRSINSPATNTWLLLGLCSIGAFAFWLNSLDRLLESRKWTLEFYTNCIWIVVVPCLFLSFARHVLSKNPDSKNKVGSIDDSQAAATTRRAR
jgi:hypothetical protein